MFTSNISFLSDFGQYILYHKEFMVSTLLQSTNFLEVITFEISLIQTKCTGTGSTCIKGAITKNTYFAQKAFVQVEFVRIAYARSIYVKAANTVEQLEMGLQFF